MRKNIVVQYTTNQEGSHISLIHPTKPGKVTVANHSDNLKPETLNSIYFPDLPECISFGNNLEEASHMAAEAASLHVYSMQCDNAEIPTPSVNLSKEDTEGNVVMPVTIHPDLFHMKKDNEYIQDCINFPTPNY